MHKYFSFVSVFRYLLMFAMLFVYKTGISQAPIIQSYSPLFSSICQGNSATITCVGLNNPTSWVWNYSYDQTHWTAIVDDQMFSGSNTSTLKVTNIFSIYTVLTFRCFPSNASGTASESNATPIIAFNASQPAKPVIKSNILGADETPQISICQGITQTVRYRSSGSDWVSNAWSFTGTNSNFSYRDTTATITFTAASTSGILSITASNGCGTSIPGLLNITVNPTPQITLSGSSCETIDLRINTSGSYFDENCQPINIVTPSGSSPVNRGVIQSCVAVSPNVPTYKGVPYVQRYYNIDLFNTLSSDIANATATITLYFLQSEFDNFNAVRGALPALPIGPADAAGISNLRVSQFHGTGTTPETYIGTNGEIDPVDNQIIWSPSANRWSVTFPITGFSGFFVSTTQLTALPLVLQNFTGSRTATGNLLQWQTNAEKNVSRFEILRGDNNNGFKLLSTVNAYNSPIQNNYSFIDKGIDYADQPWYYKLRMVDLDGSFSLSNALLIQQSPSKFFVDIYPNPVTDQQISFKINTPTAAAGKISLIDISGKIVLQKNIVLSKGINSLKINSTGFSNKGIYFLHVYTEKDQITKKVRIF